MRLRPGDLIQKRDFEYEAGVCPGGEAFVSGAWQFISFDKEGLFLVVNDLYDEGPKQVVELVSLRTCYRFMFRTRVTDATYEVINRE